MILSLGRAMSKIFERNFKALPKVGLFYWVIGEAGYHTSLAMRNLGFEAPMYPQTVRR